MTPMLSPNGNREMVRYVEAAAGGPAKAEPKIGNFKIEGDTKELALRSRAARLRDQAKISAIR